MTSILLVFFPRLRWILVASPWQIYIMATPTCQCQRSWLCLISFLVILLASEEKRGKRGAQEGGEGAGEGGEARADAGREEGGAAEAARPITNSPALNIFKKSLSAVSLSATATTTLLPLFS